MKKSKFIILSFITSLLLLSNVKASTFPIDSIGTETIDGKTIILHRVEAKETLYSIHNKYGVSVAAIIALNPGCDLGLSIGQILKIPTKITNQDKSKDQTKEVTIAIEEEIEIDKPSIVPAETENKYHTVKPGETLYGVSRQYPCSVDDIKKWNNLTSNALSIGQKLKISNALPTKEIAVNNEINKESTKIIEPKITKEVVKTEEIVIAEPEVKADEGIVIDEVELVKDIPVDEVTVDEVTITSTDEGIKTEVDKTITDTEKKKSVSRTNSTLIDLIKNEGTENETTSLELLDDDSIPSTRKVDMGGYSKIFEKGYALLLSETDDDERYLAHHRTLPEGTILQVKNIANGKSVFVRVVGTLVDDDPKIIIKLSSKAELRLGTLNNPKFLTEISYIP